MRIWDMNDKPVPVARRLGGRRTSRSGTPHDSMCRPWGQREKDRRFRQRGHAHSVAQSVALETGCAGFREVKAVRVAADEARRAAAEAALA